MKKYVLSGAFAFVCASVLTVATPTAEDGIQTQPAPPTQSSPQTQPPKSPTTQPPSTTAQRPATDQQGATQTLVGCLYRESDVPGRTPNVAEKAGVLEDYILADATMSTSGTAPTTGKMFKVEKIADDQLKQHVGKRVEVTGRIDAGASSTQPSRTPPTSGTSPTTGTPPSSGTPPTTGNPPSAGTTPPSGAARDRNPVSPDRIELPEFEAVSIKEVPGSCPSKPSAQ